MTYKNTKKLDRRNLLKAAAGSFVAWHTPKVLSATDMTVNTAKTPGPKLVWIMLRGAMDSLHAILHFGLGVLDWRLLMDRTRKVNVGVLLC